jgi:putative transposase
MNDSLALTAWECKCNAMCAVRWVPKRCQEIILGQLQKEIGTICECKAVALSEGNAGVDHVGMCVSIPLRYSGAAIGWYLKRR